MLFWMNELPRILTLASLLTSYADGSITIANDTGTVQTNTGTTYKIKAGGGAIGRQTVNLTITNSSDSTGTIAFDFASNNSGSFTIEGVAQTSGSYSKLLESGASFKIVLAGRSGLFVGDATLTLSNITFTAAAASSNVTFVFNDALGGVTVNGTAVSSGASQEATLTDTLSLKATAKSGAEFVGWVNAADSSILSTNASYTLTPASDITVKAVFGSANTAPHFFVGATTQQTGKMGLLEMSSYTYYTCGATHLFSDLNAAINVAAGKAIILANSGTLPAGDYTVPANVSLLIPFDAARTMYTENAQFVAAVDDNKFIIPEAFRTLKMAAGANLIINGTMSVSAKIAAAAGAKQNGGSPTGACSFVDMAEGSSITVNNGGKLYTYGFIHGSGTVTAKSGATVYECLQFMDFRGGTQSTQMKNRVFPFSQYYVQNIEVPLTLEAGAIEKAVAYVAMSGANFAVALPFVGTSGSMFTITSGSAKKYYDGSTDRIHIELNGNVTMSTVNVTFGTTTINSKDYDLALGCNYTVKVTSGSSSINQDIALLPGAVIEISNGATATLGSGKSLYVYDTDQWDTYCGAVNKKLIPINYAPSKTYTRTEADLEDAQVIINGTADLSAGYLYTTAGGANICSTGSGKVITKAGTATVTYQIVQASDASNSTYPKIPITPAKLKNSDGSFTLTESCSTLNTYNYVDGFWRCETHTWGDWSTGACSVCGEKAILYDAIQLSIVSEIQLLLKFTVHQDLLSNFPDLTAYVTEEKNRIEPEDSWNKKVTELPIDNGRYVISQGIAAGEMTGIVAVQFKNGETVIPAFDPVKNEMVNTVERSVISFAEAALEAEGEDGRNVELCKGALTFGGYAQQFFETHTDKLAYSFFGETAPDVAVSSWEGFTTTVTSTEDFTLIPTTQKINLDSKIDIRLYFEGEVGGCTVTVTRPINKGTDTETIALSFGNENGRTYLDIEDVPPAYWNDSYLITVTDGQSSYTVTTSVLAWCARCVQSPAASVEQQKMAQAMYHYSRAADAYFTEQNAQ